MADMKIIIAGCGKIGSAVIESLAGEGNDVVAVDKDNAVITELTNVYDIMGVCGNAADCDTLTEAGVSDCGLFVAMTESDELNMLSCFIARKMGAENTIARIRNPEYNDDSLGFLRQHLELSMAINPERGAAQEIYNILKFPSALKIETFSRRNLELIEFGLSDESALCGKSLTEIRKKYDAQFLICCVQRGEEVFIPNGNFVLEAGDKIGLTASMSEMQKLMKMLKSLKKSAKDVIVLGGSKTAFYLAQLLENSGTRVKIIEQDEARCRELTEELPFATIIRGNGTEQELLMEEGLESCDAFVALTGFDEENILLSIFASIHNVPKTVVKVNRDELAAMARNMKLGSIVSPKEITSNILMQYARALNNSSGSSVETLYQLFNGKAEALEFKVAAESKLTGVPLRELRLKPNILIAGIMRGRRTIIPSGSDMLTAGDRVVVISSKNRLNDILDILK